jgi:hypothetical protein
MVQQFFSSKRAKVKHTKLSQDKAFGHICLIVNLIDFVVTAKRAAVNFQNASIAYTFVRV